MALVNGATYRFQNRADPNRSLNVYGNSPAYLANVCLYTNNSNDICQQWVYREVGSHAYLECKGDPDLVLDLYTGSDSVAYENNYNAHVYNDVTSTCYIEILDASDDDPDYIQIKLEDYTNKYLTANQGSNGTAAGRGVNSNGNVYFYNGGLTDLSQDWKPIRLDGGSTPDPDPDPEPGEYDKNYLVYPTDTMNITQSYNGSYNHYLYSSGSPVDYPIDEACEDTGRSPFRFPCDQMKVVRLYTAGTNTLWLESTSPVVMPSGTSKVTIMVMHPEDSDMNSLYVGQTFNRGETMFYEGMDGNATGNHFHMSVGTGSYSGGIYENGWQENSNGAWVLTPTGHTLKPEDAFFVDPNITEINNDAGLDFVTIPN